MRDERSPTDPQECCEWANTRLRSAGDFSREWRTTNDPKRPIILVRTSA